MPVILEAGTSHVPSILIVDDDPDIRDALGDALTHEGYHVQSVGFGTEAIERVRGANYGAAILDMGLPDLDGESVLRQLIEVDPALPVVILTAQATTENRVGSLTRGAFAYVAKPYNLEELRATLRRAVGVKALALKAETVESALSESEDRFRSVVQSATDAIVIGDSDGRIVSWNRAAEAMFGYTEQEVLRQPLTLLMPQRYRQPHQHRVERMRATGQSSLIGKVIELHGLRKDGREFPLELSLGTWKAKGETFLSAILRDIGERKRTERRQAAQYAVSRILSESQPLGETSRQILQTVCESVEWDFGAIWSVDRQGDVLRCLEVWAPPGVRVAEFEAVTRATTFARGVGLPGRVWQAGQAAWILDVVCDANFPRGSIAAEQGLHGAFAFPILIGGEVAGVIEFFTREIRPPDEALLQIMATLGSHIGHFIERKSHEERLAKINECFLSFGQKAHENINRLVALCGSLLGGSCALYSHLEGDLLHAIGRWHTPPDYIQAGKAQGHVCFDVIQSGSNEVMVVRNLPETTYAQTDPTVLPYRLQTYVGQAVRCHGANVGALCVLYQKDFVPSGGDRRVVGIIAAAIGVEEERQQAEDALRHAYDETEHILAGLPCAIVIADQDQRVIYTNLLARQYFGSGRATGIGRPVADVLPLSSEQWARLAVTSAGGAHPGSSTLPDGEFDFARREYRYRGFPVALRGSEREQTGLVIWDITEQQQLQDQLIQAEKLASLGTLVFGMAHEINNPVQGIMGMAEIILSEEDPAKIKEYAQDIVNFSAHVGTVVRNFSAYARPATREGEVEVDINERLSEAVKLVQRCPQFGHVEVAADFNPVSPVLARRAEIDQIFVNLISNAVEAMGGKGRLTLATRAKGGFVTARVADTGPGIPKAAVGKIFDPFFTTKEPGKGSGLGLSIVYKIVTKYGGHIRVETEEGRGTTFVLQFPGTRKEDQHGTERA
jgi:PAS domain S-box-containing protein